MEKICTICKTQKRILDFNKNKSKKDGISNVCRECSRIKSRRYYKENGEKHRKVVGVRRRSNQKEFRLLRDEIKSKGCSVCPEKEVCAIDFHHVDEKSKKFTIGTNRVSTYSLNALLDEVSKCVLLCSNCHRKYHFKILKLPENIQTINVDFYRKKLILNE